MLASIRFLLLGLIGLGAAASQAQNLTGPSRLAWSALSAEQRGLLAPLQGEWERITPAQQRKWAELSDRQSALTPDARGRLQERMAEWSRLPAPDRARARLNFQEARQLSAEERQAQWQAYRALPTDQRRALADQAQAKPAPRSGTRTPGVAEKSSIVGTAPLAAPQPVGPTTVQRGGGATTNLVSKPPAPPLHQQAGLPKVAASPGFVEESTLLPRRGAQGAAVRPPEQRGKGKNAER
jgi:Protein of unknown function (DUF3106)